MSLIGGEREREIAIPPGIKGGIYFDPENESTRGSERLESHEAREPRIVIARTHSNAKPLVAQKRVRRDARRSPVVQRRSHE